MPPQRKRNPDGSFKRPQGRAQKDANGNDMLWNKDTGEWVKQPLTPLAPTSPVASEGSPKRKSMKTMKETLVDDPKFPSTTTMGPMRVEGAYVKISLCVERAGSFLPTTATDELSLEAQNVKENRVMKQAIQGAKLAAFESLSSAMRSAIAATVKTGADTGARVESTPASPTRVASTSGAAAIFGAKGIEFPSSPARRHALSKAASRLCDSPQLVQDPADAVTETATGADNGDNANVQEVEEEDEESLSILIATDVQMQKATDEEIKDDADVHSEVQSDSEVAKKPLPIDADEDDLCMVEKHAFFSRSAPRRSKTIEDPVTTKIDEFVAEMTGKKKVTRVELSNEDIVERLESISFSTHLKLHDYTKRGVALRKKGVARVVRVILALKQDHFLVLPEMADMRAVLQEALKRVCTPKDVESDDEDDNGNAVAHAASILRVAVDSAESYASDEDSGDEGDFLMAGRNEHAVEDDAFVLVKKLERLPPCVLEQLVELRAHGEVPRPKVLYTVFNAITTADKEANEANVSFPTIEHVVKCINAAIRAVRPLKKTYPKVNNSIQILTEAAFAASSLQRLVTKR